MRKNVLSTSRLEEGLASARQWLLVEGAPLPEGRALEDLLRELDFRYNRWIERISAGLVRVREDGRGGIAVVVVPLGPVGLRLGPARIETPPERARIAREILSGWLVASRSGELAISLERVERGVVAAIELDRFRSRLVALGPFGRYVYLRAQVVIHRRLSRVFLTREVAPRLLAVSSPSPAFSSARSIGVR